MQADTRGAAFDVPRNVEVFASTPADVMGLPEATTSRVGPVLL
jgi:hypothetical protein